MSSRRFEPRLRIRPEHSKLLAMLLGGAHLVTLATLPLLPLPSALIGAAGIAVLLSLYRALSVHVFFRGTRAIRELVWNTSGEVVVWDGEGHEHQASISSDCFAVPWTVILAVHVQDLGRRTLVLLPDCVSVDILRQIRVRLRVARLKPGE